MPFAGLGGSTVPVAVTERRDEARHQGVPLLREHRAPVDHGLPPRRPEEKRQTTDGHALPGVELRLDDDGEILSRGPGLLRRLHRPGADRRGVRRRRLVPHRRHRRARRRRLPHDHRPDLRHHHPRRREHQRPGGRGAAAWASTPSPRSASWPRPTRGWASGPPPCSACAKAPPRRPSRRCAAHLAAAGLARQKWPEELHESTSSLARRRARSRSSCSATTCATALERYA